MSELQAEDSNFTYDGPEETTEASNEVESESNEPDNAGVDLATTSPDEGEQNTVSDSRPAVADGVDISEGAIKAINKQHLKYRDAERANTKLQEEFDAYKAQHQPPPVQDVVIPDAPETWDDNYAQKQQQREEAIRQSARNEAVKSQQNEAAARQQQQEQIDKARNDQKLNTDFVENAKKLGVNMEALDAAQNTVVNYGVSAELANVIIRDSDGPLIIQHLASNPLDLYELVNGSQFSAGQKWAEIKAKSSALKPKTSSTPKPTTKVKGSGAGVKERGPQGATFE